MSKVKKLKILLFSPTLSQSYQEYIIFYNFTNVLKYILHMCNINSMNTTDD
jgi:hypothetical protein